MGWKSLKHEDIIQVWLTPVPQMGLAQFLADLEYLQKVILLMIHSCIKILKCIFDKIIKNSKINMKTKKYWEKNKKQEAADLLTSNFKATAVNHSIGLRRDDSGPLRDTAGPEIDSYSQVRSAWTRAPRTHSEERTRGLGNSWSLEDLIATCRRMKQTSSTKINSKWVND